MAIKATINRRAIVIQRYSIEPMGRLSLSRRFPRTGFKMSLGLKDMRLALAAADARTVPMPVASLVPDHFIEGVAQGEGDANWSALGLLAARRAGLAFSPHQRT